MLRPVSSKRKAEMATPVNGNSGFKKHVDDILFDHGKKCSHSCVWIHVVGEFGDVL